MLQAAHEYDAGDIWAYREFPMGELSKSALYRHQVSDAAVDALLEAMDRLRSGTSVPEPLDYRRPEIEGRLERPVKQADREIDWSGPTAVVLRHLRCSDSVPGVLDSLFGQQCYLFGGHEEQLLGGQPGEVIARRDGAICRATGDGAVWISHLKKAKTGTGPSSSYRLPWPWPPSWETSPTCLYPPIRWSRPARIARSGMRSASAWAMSISSSTTVQ